MGTHPIFESDFDCLTAKKCVAKCPDRTRVELGSLPFSPIFSPRRAMSKSRKRKNSTKPAKTEKTKHSKKKKTAQNAKKQKVETKVKKKKTKTAKGKDKSDYTSLFQSSVGNDIEQRIRLTSAKAQNFPINSSNTFDCKY